jgi:enamine deaminase RidA (YjgF/YER057c/UK114 family)
MPDHQHLMPETMPSTAGFSQVVKAGKTVYIAGQVALTPDRVLVGEGDAEAQVRQTWRNIQSAVESVGGTLANLVKTTTFVTSMDCISATRKVRAELFPGGNAPPGTIVEINRLSLPEAMVEIEAIAVLD